MKTAILDAGTVTLTGLVCFAAAAIGQASVAGAELCGLIGATIAFAACLSGRS